MVYGDAEDGSRVEKQYGEESITQLKNQKKGVKGWITRIQEEIDTLTASTTNKVFLEVKEERLRSLFLKYENIAFQIQSLDPSVVDDGKVEDSYTTTLVKIKQLLSTISAESVSNVPSKQANDRVTVPTKLPQIDICPFSGKYSEYKTFIALFNSLIHKNDGLEKIQKLYYLRSFLRGEASDLIKNLPLLDDSYDESLKILDKRYNNEFLIKSEHINILLDIPAITRSTSVNLRSFVSNVKQQLASLKNLNVNVDDCPIVLTVLLRKLDILCSREFQIMSSHDKIEPTLSSLILFLEERALALENTGASAASGGGGTVPNFQKVPMKVKPPATMKAVEEDKPASSCLLFAEP